MLSRLIAKLALLPVALQMVILATAAQSTTSVPISSTTSTPTPTTLSKTASRTTSKSGPATHTVKVGYKQDPHQYIPSTIIADVGDEVLFEFYPRNHSVVEAEFLAPCVPASGNYFYSGAFDSFHEKDGAMIGPPPTWKLTVNHTRPIFFYCTATDSCTGNGMVGAINPNASMTWEQQYAKALKYPYMLVPGQAPPAEGSPRPPASPSSTSKPHPHPSDLSPGAIAGIVIGSLAGVALLAVLFFVLGRNRVYRKWLTSEEGSHERTRNWALSGEDWSTAGRSEKDGTTTSVGHTIHTNISPDLNGPHSPPLRSPPLGSPPLGGGYPTWDNMGNYHTPGMQEERPRELNSGIGNQLVELEASPRSKEYFHSDH